MDRMSAPLKAVARLRFKPGDVLLVQLEGTPPPSIAERVHRAVRSILEKSGHADTQVLICDGDVAISQLPEEKMAEYGWVRGWKKAA